MFCVQNNNRSPKVSPIQVKCAASMLELSILMKPHMRANEIYQDFKSYLFILLTYKENEFSETVHCHLNVFIINLSTATPLI